MRKVYSKVGLVLMMLYILLVVAAFAYSFIMIQYYPSNSEFSGVYITALTLPWSLLGILMLIVLSTVSVDFSFGSKVILIIGALLNMIIIYKVAIKIEKKGDNK